MEQGFQDQNNLIHALMKENKELRVQVQSTLYKQYQEERQIVVREPEVNEEDEDDDSHARLATMDVELSVDLQSHLLELLPGPVEQPPARLKSFPPPASGDWSAAMVIRQCTEWLPTAGRLAL